MSAEDVDVDKCIVKEKNVQRRMAFMNKIGVDLLYQKLGGKVIEDDGNMYKLVYLNIGELYKCPYLYMRNPSIGVYHLEGVPKGTKTIDEALHSRKPPLLRKIPVSSDGAEWYQQGDVCIWPKNAKSIKPRPSVLT